MAKCPKCHKTWREMEDETPTECPFCGHTGRDETDNPEGNPNQPDSVVTKLVHITFEVTADSEDNAQKAAQLVMDQMNDQPHEMISAIIDWQEDDDDGSAPTGELSITKKEGRIE